MTKFVRGREVSLTQYEKDKKANDPYLKKYTMHRFFDKESVGNVDENFKLKDGDTFSDPYVVHLKRCKMHKQDPQSLEVFDFIWFSNNLRIKHALHHFSVVPTNIKEIMEFGIDNTPFIYANKNERYSVDSCW